MISIRTTTTALAALTLFFVLSAVTPNALAAEAQSPPEAQKPPVAKKQPKPRAATALKLGSYDDSWKEKAYSNPVAAEYSPSRTVAVSPAKPVAAVSAAAAKPQAKADSSAKPAAASKGKRHPDDPAVLKEGLDHFAKDCIVRMNRQLRPGITHKEIKRQADGTFVARYMAIDPDSLATSYNPTDNNKIIKYIGRMEYHEVEYVSVGKDQKQALAGPFNETNRMPVTELIKYKSGKWCY